MKSTTLFNVATRAIRHPAVFLSRKKYLFVVSHMRGYTTLISHILGTHPDISGYSENHISYRTPLDLLKLRHRVSEAIGGAIRGSYVLDKILHNFEISRRIVRRRNVYFCFTLRQPEPTLRSIVRMKQKLSQADGEPNLRNDILPNYLRRLDGIRQLCEQLGSEYFFFHGEELVDTPERLLPNLSDWLKLAEPLESEYETFKYTGVPGRGDFSQNIHAGRIIRKQPDVEDFELPQDVIAEAQNKYRETAEALAANAWNKETDGT